MPESIFSQIRFEMEVKYLLRSLFPNSFRDVALCNKLTDEMVFQFASP
jgi:hypothetical protein